MPVHLSTGKWSLPGPRTFRVLVPGQIASREIIAFLKALDVKEIHGYRPNLGLRVFREAVLGDLPTTANAETATAKPKRKAKNGEVTQDELATETVKA